MSDDDPKHQPSAHQMFGVGENNTLNFFLNLSDADRAALLKPLQAEGISRAEFETLLRKVDQALSAQAELHARVDALERPRAGVAVEGDADVGGDVVGRDKTITAADIVYGNKVVFGSADVRELLQRVMPALQSQPRLKDALYAASRAGEPDLTLDYQELARGLRDRHRRGDALERAKREEPLYVPLPITFARHRRASAQSPFEQDHKFNDIVEAVHAPQGGPDSEPHAALVLLGAPGGGKSTALRHLALHCLNALLVDAQQRLPLFVSLGEYKPAALSRLRRALDEPDLQLTPLNFLRAHWFEWFSEDGFEHALDEGRLWLILDGLNEIADRDARIPDWRQFFDRDAGRFDPRNRAVIACRRADYGNRLDLPYLDVEALDAERIRDFLRKRLGQANGDAIMERLEADDDLMEVVSNPFWLKMLADYAQDFDRLPDNRTALIDWFVQKWLGRESGRADLPPLSPERIEALKVVFDALAYGWLEQSDNAPLPWHEAVARSAEEALHRGETASLLVCETIGERSVKFYHQLLLEYFAARELARRFRRNESQMARWRIPWGNWAFVQSEWRRLSEPPTTRWEEATVFAAARPEIDADAFVRAVLVENPPLAARCVLESGRDVSADVREAVRERLLALVERRDALLQDVADGSARLSLRIAAGHALGKLGDPRILAGQGSVTITDKETEFIEPIWQRVPAGPFTMGSETGYAQEKPEHVCDVIKNDYTIGMFPVTNAEFECFVQAGGYSDERWWRTDAARHWLSEGTVPGQEYLFQVRFFRENPGQLDELVKQNRLQPDVAEVLKILIAMTDEEVIESLKDAYSEQPRDRPALWGDRDLNGRNQPVVGVCWYEALAYCVWLTAVLRAAGRIREDQEVALPNEPEWEKAARAQLPSSTLQSPTSNTYPWGDDTFEIERANTLDGRVLNTTPVGLYDNAGPCGALDMSGNVWEWTRSRWGHDPQTPAFGYPYGERLAERESLEGDDYRVVRGGSWYYVASLARCACRGGGSPVFRYYFLGFRCVLRLLIA